MKNPDRFTLRAILRDAHDTTRATLREFPGADYSATLAAALRDAWTRRDAIAARAAESPAAQWAAMTPDEQTAMLVAMTWHAKKHLDIGTGPDGRPRRVVMDWIESSADAMTNAGEAWLRMPRMIEKAAERRPDMPLASIACKTVLRAAEAIKDEMLGSPRAIKRRQPRKPGEADHLTPAEKETAARGRPVFVEYVDGDGRGPVKARTVSPHDHAASVDALERACTDNLDRIIAAARIAGYTQKDIAARTGVTQKTISTRLHAMAERYHAADADDAACLAYRIRKRLA